MSGVVGAFVISIWIVVGATIIASAIHSAIHNLTEEIRKKR